MVPQATRIKFTRSPKRNPSCDAVGQSKGAFVWDQSGIRIIGLIRVSVCLGAILIPEYLDFHSDYSTPRSRIAKIYSGIHSYSGISQTNAPYNWPAEQPWNVSQHWHTPSCFFKLVFVLHLLVTFFIFLELSFKTIVTDYVKTDFEREILYKRGWPGHSFNHPIVNYSGRPTPERTYWDALKNTCFM